jgi:hypothetical protein
MDPELLLKLCDAARAGEDLGALRADLIGEASSARLVAAWFEDGARIGLLARRPAGARGHDDDEVSVALTEGLAEPATLVFDSWLSTTYAGTGEPLRFGIELWLGVDEDGDQRPLRITGEASGEALLADGVQIQPVVARSSRHQGDGVYVLAGPA